MNLRQIDLNLLLVFDVVYSTRSNTKAAEKLGVTQSAVSNALKRLREHLGDPLFERHGHDFVPTMRAERLAPLVRDALNAMREALGTGDDFDPVTSDRVFSLVLPDSIEIRLMPLLINMVTERGYGVSFRVQSLFGVNFRTVLEQKRADLVFLHNPLLEQHFQSAFLFEEGIYMVCRADHPVYGNAESFTLADMERIQLITLDESLRTGTHTEQEMREKGVRRNIVCTAARLWSLPYLVMATDGFAPLPRSMALTLAERFNLKLFDMPVDRPNHQWHMAWHEQMERDPAHQWLRQTVKDLFETV